MKKLFFLFLAFFLLINSLFAAEKKPKVTIEKKPISVNDENVDTNMKNAEELLKKGELGRAFELFHMINEYSKEVLKAIEVVEEKEKKILESKNIDQNTKEAVIWKLKRKEALKSRYKEYYARSAYFLGFILAKRNDNLGASRYLTEALKNSSFSTKPDSTYMRSLKLLATIFALEGEI